MSNGYWWTGLEKSARPGAVPSIQTPPLWGNLGTSHLRDKVNIRFFKHYLAALYFSLREAARLGAYKTESSNELNGYTLNITR
jgi:hypothetical protein